MADGPEGSNVTADDASTTVAPPAAVPTATTSTPALDECSPVIARMSRGVDQSYLDNPDELVFGATFCKFCANGTMVSRGVRLRGSRIGGECDPRAPASAESCVAIWVSFWGLP